MTMMLVMQRDILLVCQCPYLSLGWRRKQLNQQCAGGVTRAQGPRQSMTGRIGHGTHGHKASGHQNGK